MRTEKLLLTKEYVARLNASPFFMVLGFQGLKVSHLTELRQRLAKAGGEVHVVKNTIFAIAAKETGIAELKGSITGQSAVVTGTKDVSVIAKVLKNFASEFDKLKIKFGYLNNQHLDEASIIALSDLPSIEVLRAKLLGLLNAPATKLTVLLNTPGTMLAQVLKAKVDKANEGEQAPKPE
jgi:large subunit ribosomal protein L10